MPYNDALEWLVDNIPLGQFSDYRDWRDACMREINTPALWNSPDFNNMHEDAWKDIMDRKRFGKQQELELEQEEPERIEIRKPDATFTELSRDALGNVFTKVETIKLNPQFEPVGIDLPEKAFVPSVRPSLPESIPIPQVGNIAPQVVSTGNVVTRFFSTAGSAIRRLFRV